MTSPDEPPADAAAPPRRVPPPLRQDELQSRLTDVRASRDRVHSLLAAVLAVGSDLDLPTVLHRITEAASTLVDAQYAALGVISEDGVQLSQFITVGVDDEARARIGTLPRGHGILGRLIRDPRPLRLDDLGSDDQAYGFPPNHPPMRSFLGVPVRVRNDVFGNLYLTEKRGGGAFTAEDEEVVLALAAAAGVALENARLYDSARRRERWLRASADITTRLLAGAEPEEVLALVAARAREITGATTSCVALPSGPTRLLVEVADGLGAADLVGSVLLVEGTPYARVVHDGSPVLLTGDATGQILPGATVHSALLAPLGVDSVLVLTSHDGGPELAAVSLEELSTFVAQATLALEVAEHRRDAERVVVFEDRDRIARDLHDLVIQRLFATGMQLESAARLIERPEAAGRVRRAVDDLDATIREIRSTIYALTQEPVGERTSLRTRLFEVVDASVEQLGLTPAVRMTGLVDTAVPDAAAVHLIAGLREALSNAARHAAASRVDVVVDVGDELRLTVRDDGCGLPAQLERRSGLANLASRAAEVGGTFTVGPGPDGGTELVWTAALGAP